MHLIHPRASVIMTVPLSGLGRLASIWFKLMQIHCIRVVHKKEYVEKLSRETNEPVLYSGSPDFVQQLRTLCRQHNVTAAFEMVGGPLSDQIFSALQPDAVHAQIGFMETWSVPQSEANKRAELFVLLEWLESHPAEASAILQEVSRVLPTLTASDSLRVFPVSDCADALTFFLHNRSKSRVQIQFRS
jgi:NADPH:quinone reductase-like Zn-dependent oxidoreductase